MKRLRGFTLTELMIVIVVLAVLVTIALPAMQRALENRRLVGAAEALQGQIVLARSLAMQQSRPAYLIMGNDNGAWLAGIALANDDNDEEREWVPNELTLANGVCIATDGTTAVASNAPNSGTIRCLAAADYRDIVLIDDDDAHFPSALAISRFEPIRGTYVPASGNLDSFNIAIDGRDPLYRVEVSRLGRVTLCTFGSGGRYSQCPQP